MITLRKFRELRRYRPLHTDKLYLFCYCHPETHTPSEKPYKIMLYHVTDIIRFSDRLLYIKTDRATGKATYIAPESEEQEEIPYNTGKHVLEFKMEDIVPYVEIIDKSKGSEVIDLNVEKRNYYEIKEQKINESSTGQTKESTGNSNGKEREEKKN